MKKLKIINIGLVVFLLVAGFGSVFVNAVDPENSNLTSSPMKLIIDSPINWTTFLEPVQFQISYINIRVLNQFNYPIYDAVIHIYELEKNQVFSWRGFTDINGIAKWPVPNVDHDKTYKIVAEKFLNGKYKECTVYITIRNRYLKFFLNTNFIDEGKEFFGIVKDQDNQPVFMATVKFNGETRFTNNYGITSSFKAPWVNQDTTFTIDTSAQIRGYDDNHSTITVFNCNDPLTHKIYGEVRDYDFKPLQNVRITIIKGRYSYDVYTNENGQYFLWITPNEGGEHITVKASLEGYLIKSETRFVNSNDANPLHINFWFNN